MKLVPKIALSAAIAIIGARVLLPAINEPAPATPPPENSAPDFLLEWYKLHRMHELELNKATLAYELELARLLVLLNGAAAGAFLTLTGAILKEGRLPSFSWVACAIISWLIGLLAAAIATEQAYKVQRGFTEAFKFRRYGEELRRIQELRQIDGTVIEPRHLGIDIKLMGKLVGKADEARTQAAQRSKMVSHLRLVAVVFFVLGGASALMAFYLPLTSRPLASHVDLLDVAWWIFLGR